jgi:23S rRNA (guanosine2251-2'-O)-methyltransferase
VKNAPHKKTAWLYGLNPVVEALRAGRARAVYLSAGRREKVEEVRREAARQGVPVRLIHDPAFFDSRFPRGHQGLAAEVQRQEALSVEELLEVPARRGEPPFFVVLDLIEDPRNVGAVLRSAEAAGVHGVVMQERRQAGLGPEAVKSSAGAAEHIAVSVVPNIKHALLAMEEAGVEVVGAEAGGHPPPWEADLTGGIALVIGSEGKGLRRTVSERCGRMVSLPMRGRVNSLNTSVAAGVLIYEALRQRLLKSQG